MRNEKYEKPDFSSKVPFSDSYENEKLWKYIKNVWEDTAEYKVMMSNRMFNLNYLLMNEWHAHNNKEFLLDNIMSDTAFLMSANSIANRYARRNRFPRILICDDVMTHGSDIIRLLDRFCKIVSKHLVENQVEISDRKLASDLRNAVCIYAYAGNRNEEMFMNLNHYWPYFAKIVPMNRLHELSLHISDYLLDCGALNTNYTISVKLPWHYIRNLISSGNTILTKPFKYKGRSQNFFFREISTHFLETMRLYYPEGDPKKGGVLTSHTFFGDISGEDFKTLCNDVALYIEQYFDNSQIARFLRQEDICLVEAKTQLLTFLYSLLSLTDFCRQSFPLDKGDLYRILVSGDFNKIISNFDIGDLFRYEILTLFRYICTSRFKDRVLWYFLVRATQDLYAKRGKNTDTRDDYKFRMIPVPGKDLLKKEYTEAEDLFYQVGMDAEYDAYQYIYSKTALDVNKPSFNHLRFQKYMRLMKIKGCNSDYAIGILFGMIDRGLVSINIQAVGSSELEVVHTVLKADEMVACLLPERFSIFIPALAEVEKNYEQIGRNIYKVMKAFIEFLQYHCYVPNENFDMTDMFLLKELKEKEPFLSYLYSDGHKVEDWDIDFRNVQKYYTSRFAKKRDGFSFEEERYRKNYYLRCAKYFINEQKTLSRKMRNE